MAVHVDKGEGAYMERIDNIRIQVCDQCSTKIPKVMYKVKIYKMDFSIPDYRLHHICASCAKKLFPNYFK